MRRQQRRRWPLRLAIVLLLRPCRLASAFDLRASVAKNDLRESPRDIRITCRMCVDSISATGRRAFLDKAGGRAVLAASAAGIILSSTPTWADPMIWRGMAGAAVVGSEQLFFPPQFVAYLARFLLNFDEDCRLFYSSSITAAVPERRQEAEWETFAALAASVDIGLRRYQEPGGAEVLARQLYDRYAVSEAPSNSADADTGAATTAATTGAPAATEAARQLGLLFSFLPPSRQPLGFLDSILKTESMGKAAGAGRPRKGGGRSRPPRGGILAAITAPVAIVSEL
ncbi:unnamed protein product, partial [Phaeothamnion confervicola]